MSKLELRTKNIIILGSSYAGIETIHLLLGSILPKLPNPSSYKLIIISPSSSLYWSLSAPRMILNLPKHLGTRPTQETAFVDIPSALKAKYGDGKAEGKVQWEFIPAFARSVDPEAKVVQFERIAGKEDSINLSLPSTTPLESTPYEHLVVATGSRPDSTFPHSAMHPPLPPPPFKHYGTTAQTKAALEQWSTAIAASKTILVAGAGPTGVETAGELAFAFPEKKIYLISTGDNVLPMMLEKVQKTAHRFLETLKVTIQTNAKVTNVTTTTDATSPVQVTLSTGKIIPVDLYIPAHHSFTPNTEFFQKTGVLDNHKQVIVGEHLNNPTYPTIWAVGDVASHKGNKNVSAIDGQALSLAHNLRAVLSGRPHSEYKQYKHPPPKGWAVPIGRNQGTGQFGNWRLWSILVWLLKGRDYMVGSATKIVTGVASVSGGKLQLK